VNDGLVHHFFFAPSDWNSFFRIVELRQLIELVHSLEEPWLAGLQHLATNDNFVHHLIHFREIENQIELAYIAKVGIKHLNKKMDQLESCKLVIVHPNRHAKVQASVSPVDQLGKKNFQDTTWGGGGQRNT